MFVSSKKASRTWYPMQHYFKSCVSWFRTTICLQRAAKKQLHLDKCW